MRPSVKMKLCGTPYSIPKSIQSCHNANAMYNMYTGQMKCSIYMIQSNRKIGTDRQERQTERERLVDHIERDR